MNISIITATFNSFPAIVDCLDSLKSQTVKFESIIVDGGSTDKTISVFESSNLISKYISEPDKGIYDALNKGIRMSTGDIIGLLHSDDLFASESILGKIVKTFNVTDADVVYGDLVYVDKNNISKIIRRWKSKPFEKRMLQKGWMPAHPTVFIKREVYQKHGFFDLNYKIAADYDLMLRIFSDEKLKFVYIPEVITKMRVGGESNKSIKNIVRKSREDYRIMKKNGIKYPVITILFKNLSKISQFVIK